jgi:hypothetical protein
MKTMMMLMTMMMIIIPFHLFLVRIVSHSEYMSAGLSRSSSLSCLSLVRFVPRHV